MPKRQQYWLMKSEPETYSLADLERDGRTPWEGVRNYQARNFMRDDMKVGDQVLFYHSNTKEPGVAGTGTVSREAHPDFTAWDRKSPYFDPKASPEKPIWMMVEVAFEERFNTLVSRNMMREDACLKDMAVLKRGMRLSVLPVTKAEFERVRALGRA